MRVRLPFVLAITAVVGVGLSACTTNDHSDTVRSASATAPAVSASASASPAPDTAISGVQTKFDDTNRNLAASNANAGDTAIIDALVAAGFEKSAMQITPDTISIGRKADSIEVSVLVNRMCLIGQFRGATYVSEVAPVLSTGHCLIGTTQPID